MDGWISVLRPFNSISVISRRWKGEHEKLCAMKRRLGSGRISPPAGFKPATPWSKVGSANRLATRMLLFEQAHLQWRIHQIYDRYHRLCFLTMIREDKTSWGKIMQISLSFTNVVKFMDATWLVLYPGVKIVTCKSSKVLLENQTQETLF